MRKTGVFILALALIFVADVAFGQGCSQCKLIAEQGSELDEASFGSSINSGILFLMGIPYMIMMAIAFVYRKQIMAYFRAKLKRA